MGNRKTSCTILINWLQVILKVLEIVRIFKLFRLSVQYAEVATDMCGEMHKITRTTYIAYHLNSVRAQTNLLRVLLP